MANDDHVTPQRRSSRVSFDDACGELYQPWPVLLVTLEGEIRAANLLSSWLCETCPGRGLLGLNIYDLCTQAVQRGRIPVYFNQPFIRKKLRVLSLLDPNGELEQHQLFKAAVAKAATDQSDDSYTQPLSLADETNGDQVDWRYPLRVRRPGSWRESRLLEFVVTDSRLIHSVKRVLIVFMPDEGVTSRVMTEVYDHVADLFPSEPYVLSLDTVPHDNHRSQTTSKCVSVNGTAADGLQGRGTNGGGQQASTAVSKVNGPFESVDWHPGEEFEPQANMIEAFLGRRTDSSQEHPVFGREYAWDLAPNRSSSPRLELYPERRLARLQYGDPMLGPQKREYLLDHISARVTADGATLILAARLEGQRITLCVHSTGEFDEHLRFTPRPELEVQDEAAAMHAVAPVPRIAPPPDQLRPLTVAEAAGVMKVDPSYVKKLIYRKRLPAIRRGRTWFLDPAAVHGFERARRTHNS